MQMRKRLEQTPAGTYEGANRRRRRKYEQATSDERRRRNSNVPAISLHLQPQARRSHGRPPFVGTAR